jgi:hypothetical protein
VDEFILIRCKSNAFSYALGDGFLQQSAQYLTVYIKVRGDYQDSNIIYIPEPGSRGSYPEERGNIEHE